MLGLNLSSINAHYSWKELELLPRGGTRTKKINFKAVFRWLIGFYNFEWLSRILRWLGLGGQTVKIWSKVSAMHARPGQTESQVHPSCLLASPFGQDLKMLLPIFGWWVRFGNLSDILLGGFIVMKRMTLVRIHRNYAECEWTTIGRKCNQFVWIDLKVFW